MRNACIDVAWSKGRERIPFEVADIGDLSSDFEVKRAVRAYLGERCPDLTDYAVLRAGPTRYYLRVPLTLRLRRAIQRLDAWCARRVGPESALEAWLRQRLRPLGLFLQHRVLAPGLLLQFACVAAVGFRLGGRRCGRRRWGRRAARSGGSCHGGSWGCSVERKAFIFGFPRPGWGRTPPSGRVVGRR